MKTIKNISVAITLIVMVVLCGITACTKYQDGFLSPNIQYAVSEFTMTRGRVSSSYSIISDGSSIPLSIKWTHIYDSTGKVVDDIFSKKYLVTVWSAAYNASTDTTYALITAKRTTDSLPPLVLNEKSGTITSTTASLNVPVGSYSMDIQITNSAGTEEFKNMITINIVDGKEVEISPETGNFSLSLLVAGTAGGAGAAGGSNSGTLFNGANNPMVDYTLTRLADTPNLFVVRVTDKNGVVFNPKNGEIAKRPASGLNPNPAYLQNLQDYAPDTFTATDTAMTLLYPLVPFPIATLGNGFNMYYRIPTKYVHIDSTSAWSSNSPGNFYQGAADTHYLGAYTDDKYDYALRIPLRIQVPGAYQLNIKLLNTTHR